MDLLTFTLVVASAVVDQRESHNLWQIDYKWETWSSALTPDYRLSDDRRLAVCVEPVYGITVSHVTDYIITSPSC